MAYANVYRALLHNFSGRVSETSLDIGKTCKYDARMIVSYLYHRYVCWLGVRVLRHLHSARSAPAPVQTEVDVPPLPELPRRVSKNDIIISIC